MAKEIIMPKFGFTQENSEILEWLKKEGEKVEKGDPIAVVSTDKISMEVEAPETGILSGISHKVGEIVPVTEIIAYILQPGEALPEASSKKPEIAPAKVEAAPQVSSIVKISPLAVKLIEEHQINAAELTGTGARGQVSRKDVEDFLARRSTPEGKIKATPAARRVGKELQVDLHGITGSGPEGRIQATDVSLRKATPVIQKAPGGLPGVLKEIPLIGMRRMIADNMARSMREAPHMTLQIDVQMDAVEALRKSANEKITEKNSRISATAVIVKAVTLAIKKNPIVNSQFASEKILVFSDINIGVATALEEGLIVPVIHAADQRTVSQISIVLNDLALRARENKLKPEDLANGTFTISNLGMFGIDRFTAIINPPQSAILAVGAIKRQMVPDDTEDQVIRIKKMLTFTLSADHRVMDGVQAAYFLAELRNILEKPEELV
ncbi:MAG: dihydrolipoamide acetyltransferase family protein [Pelolinea sp.]|nr:dihydrolipoamide acetyltransferase family protein [Pelolinea sp.]